MPLEKPQNAGLNGVLPIQAQEGSGATQVAPEGASVSENGPLEHTSAKPFFGAQPLETSHEIPSNPGQSRSNPECHPECRITPCPA